MTDYLQAQYNLDDQTLASIIDDLSLWSAPFGLMLLDKVRYKKNIHALDVGFGSGFPLVELAMRLGSSSKVYGIDPWKAGIERTKLKLELAGINNVELYDGVAEKMPFEDRSFDLIVSNNGLNNVQDLSKVLSECNRVAKTGAQFILTFNMEQTFIEFYEIFRTVLIENGLQEDERKIDSHIYSKRRPLKEFQKELEVSGFKISSIHQDEFYYRFADGTSMLNHFGIKFGFLGPWKEIIPEDRRTEIFQKIEIAINQTAEKNQGFAITVPYAAIDCEKMRG